MSINILNNNELSAEETKKQADKYTNLKISEFMDISDNNLLFAVNCWIEGKFAPDFSDMGYVITHLAEPCQFVYCCSYFINEVLVDGFNQAFFNISPDFIYISSLAFREIEEDECAEIIDSYIQKFKSQDEKIINTHAENIMELFAASYTENLQPKSIEDEDFKSAFNLERFNRKIIRYIRDNYMYFGDSITDPASEILAFDF